MDSFLDVERRGVDDEVAPVLLVLAAPDELRVEVANAPFVGHTHGILLRLLQRGLVFGRGDLLARGLVVLEGFDGLRVIRHLNHRVSASGSGLETVFGSGFSKKANAAFGLGLAAFVFRNQSFDGIEDGGELLVVALFQRLDSAREIAV